MRTDLSFVFNRGEPNDTNEAAEFKVSKKKKLKNSKSHSRSTSKDRKSSSKKVSRWKKYREDSEAEWEDGST